MKTKFTIGEIAKIYNISKQTLIFYDNLGLFKPEIVDNENGYRIYSANQFELLNTILMLKECKIPLKQIKEFLEIRDTNSSLELFTKQKQELDEKIKEYKIMSKRLGKKINNLHDLKEYHTSVFFKEMEDEYLYFEHVNSPYNFTDIDLAFKHLLQNIQSLSSPYEYLIGVTVPLDNLLSGNYTKADNVFVPLEKIAHDTHVHNRKKGVYAISYHVGTYDSIEYTYKLLFDEIASHNYKAISCSYEYCILDNLTEKNEKNYVTKIMILVEKSTNSQID